jgi:hypothetical protein
MRLAVRRTSALRSSCERDAAASRASSDATCCSARCRPACTDKRCQTHHEPGNGKGRAFSWRRSKRSCRTSPSIALLRRPSASALRYRSCEHLLFHTTQSRLAGHTTAGRPRASDAAAAAVTRDDDDDCLGERLASRVTDRTRSLLSSDISACSVRRQRCSRSSNAWDTMHCLFIRNPLHLL